MTTFYDVCSRILGLVDLMAILVVVSDRQTVSGFELADAHSKSWLISWLCSLVYPIVKRSVDLSKLMRIVNLQPKMYMSVSDICVPKTGRLYLSLGWSSTCIPCLLVIMNAME